MARGMDQPPACAAARTGRLTRVKSGPRRGWYGMVDTMRMEMKRTLVALARHCRGDRRLHCPILDDLAGERT
jgi:hypothetical protein